MKGNIVKCELNGVRLAKSGLTDNVYVGILNKGSKTWARKKDITNDFIKAVLDRFHGYKTTIKDSKGTLYEIHVSLVTPYDIDDLISQFVEELSFDDLIKWCKFMAVDVEYPQLDDMYPDWINSLKEQLGEAMWLVSAGNEKLE